MATDVLRPDGGTTTTQLDHNSGSENWTCVDEETADGDTTYVYTKSTTGERDLYTLSAGTGSGTITGITVYVIARRTSGGSSGNDVRIDINVGGTLYFSPTFVPTTSYAPYSQPWANNPKTGVAWTWDDIAALEAGALLKTASGFEVRMTQLYVEVEYTAVADATVTPPAATATAAAFAPTVTGGAMVEAPAATAAAMAFVPTVMAGQLSSQIERKGWRIRTSMQLAAGIKTEDSPGATITIKEQV